MTKNAVMEDKYAVDIQLVDEDEHRFYLASTVAQAESPSEAELKMLLDANLFGQGPARRLSPTIRTSRKSFSSAASMRGSPISSN